MDHPARGQESVCIHNFIDHLLERGLQVTATNFGMYNDTIDVVSKLVAAVILFPFLYRYEPLQHR